MSIAARIAATVFVLVLGGLVLACDLVTPTGEVATAKLFVDPGPNPSAQDLAVAETALIRYAELTESRSVMQAVIAQLGLDEDAESLRGRISTTTSEDELLLTIEVRDEDPDAARVLALALGDEMIWRVADSQVTPEPIKAVPPERKNVGDDPDRPERPSIMRNLLVWFEKPTAPEAAVTSPAAGQR